MHPDTLNFCNAQLPRKGDDLKPQTEALTSRQKILETAAKLFIEHGYRGISMREISEKTNLSKAALYHHFRDKEELFLSILRANVERHAEVVKQATLLKQTIRARFEFMVEEFLNLPHQERAMVRLATQEMVHISEEACNLFRNTYHANFLKGIDNLLLAGMNSGELRKLNIPFARTVFFGICFPFLCMNEAETTIAIKSTKATAHDIVCAFFDGVTGTTP
jgi:AcrR family transcriptional regulator